MSVFVVAEAEVNAPLAAVFAHFIDFPKWKEWMPEIFTPVSGPSRSFRADDTFKVRIGRVPVSLRISNFRSDAEFGWQGGTPLLIQGTHVFKFSAAGAKTKIRSEETLKGLLAPDLFANRIKRDASEQAMVLMERFARHFSLNYVGDSARAS